MHLGNPLALLTVLLLPMAVSPTFVMYDYMCAHNYTLWLGRCATLHNFPEIYMLKISAIVYFSGTG